MSENSFIVLKNVSPHAIWLCGATDATGESQPIRRQSVMSFRKLNRTGSLRFTHISSHSLVACKLCVACNCVSNMTRLCFPSKLMNVNTNFVVFFFWRKNKRNKPIVKRIELISGVFFPFDCFDFRFIENDLTRKLFWFRNATAMCAIYRGTVCDVYRDCVELSNDF